ncbi:MAG: hypothetical protein ABL993_02555 [Vicinamibacterales bacterium]
MRVEIVANKLSDTDQATGQHYLLAKGDVVTVSDEYGKKLCDAGWAKDTSGEYASAPFTPGAARLKVDPLKIQPTGRV